MWRDGVLLCVHSYGDGDRKMCGTFACWKLGISLMLRFISAVKVFTRLQPDLRTSCLKLRVLKIPSRWKNKIEERRFSCPPAIGVSVMPCYEQGRFYQRQIQAVGFLWGDQTPVLLL